jgi:hypothetical protein
MQEKNKFRVGNHFIPTRTTFTPDESEKSLLRSITRFSMTIQVGTFCKQFVPTLGTFCKQFLSQLGLIKEAPN